MLGYTLRRLPSGLVVLALASVVVFSLLRLTPGNPAVVLAGPDPTPENVAAIKRSLGLDESLPSQYFHWLGGIFHGDLGKSYIFGSDNSTLIGRALGATVTLALAALVFMVLFGGTAGLILGTTKRRWLSAVVNGCVSLALAVPPYVFGILAILVFAVQANVLPATGYVAIWDDPSLGIQYLLMPAVSLSLLGSAVVARFLSTSIKQAAEQEYVVSATAKGLPGRRVTLRHILPNALPPVITVLGIQTGQLLGGAIVVEAVFAWPGLGQLLVNATLQRDYLLVQDLLLLAVSVFVIVQILTDLLQAAADPRRRLGGAS